MFQFTAFASHGLCIQPWILQKEWVSPFGHLRIKARLPAPVAFRRLPRPSSPVIAKASTTCTCSLDPITSLSHRQSLQVEFSRCAVFQIESNISSNHLEIHRYNHNPDSFHVHLKTLPLSKLLASSRLLKNDSRYILRITLTGSIANAKFSVQCLNQALSVGDWWRQTGSNRRPLLAKQVLSQLSYAPMSTDLPQVLPPDNGGSGWIRTNDPRLIKTVL